MLFLKYVFNLLKDEKERLAVHEVAGITAKILRAFDRLKIVCEFYRLSLREENYPFIYHKAIKEDLHLYEIKIAFQAS